MKKVLFDGSAIQTYTEVSFHGGGEYAKIILAEFLKRGYVFDIFFLTDRQTPEDVQDILNSSNINKIHLSNKYELYALLDNGSYDVFYSAIPYDYFDYKGNTPIIGVIHGLRNIELPWDRYYYIYEPDFLIRLKKWIISELPFTWRFRKRKYKSQMGRLISNPRFRFVTVSEHSKHALLNFFPVLRPDTILVQYPPIELCTLRPPASLSTSDYYLLISGNRPEKNVFRAIKAFDKLISDGRLSDKYIIITGVPDSKIFTGIRNLKNFIFYPYVSKEKFDQLFQDAYCFVYPSLNEGFGIPPLQAMAFGTPVIASSATSIPEVCEAAALYFSPTNIDDLCSRILEIEYNPIVYNLLVNAGLKRIEELKQIMHRNKEMHINLIFNILLQ